MKNSLDKASILALLEECKPFLEGQITFHNERSKEYKNYPKRAAKHLETADNNELVLSTLKEFAEILIENSEAESESTKHPHHGLSLRDLEELPKELLDELSIKADGTEFAIVEVIEECGGSANLDQILVGVYKKTGEVLKRTPLTNRLYRMAQREQVYSVPGKKGVYSLDPQELSSTVNQSDFIEDYDDEDGGES